MSQNEFDNGRSSNAPAPMRVPPHALEAEESLIGAMLLSPDAVSDASEKVSPEDFYRPLHGQIYTAILALTNGGEPVDLVTVQAKLQEQGVVAIDLGLLSSLSVNTPSVNNAAHYAQLVHDKAQQRRLIAVSTEIADDSYKPTDDVVALIDESESKINKIGDGSKAETVAPLQKLLIEEANILELRGETRGQFNGLETGYTSLDQILQGLQPHALTIVGARPAMGKTAFALGILTHVGAVVKRPALFFSLEMGKQELAERILASTARIDSSKLRTGDLSESDWSRAQDAFTYLQSAKIFIDDNPMLTVMDIRSRARRVKQQNGDLGVVIVDYLQLMSNRGKAENRQVEVAEMSRALKILARELSCPVIALSQLSRALEGRADKRPMMSDLRESGSLEQDADVVLFLYRSEVYAGEVPNNEKSEAEVIVAKNRNGPTDTARLTWRGEFARFDNMADPRKF
jgi:replicative DNA helicase